MRMLGQVCKFASLLGQVCLVNFVGFCFLSRVCLTRNIFSNWMVSIIGSDLQTEVCMVGVTWLGLLSGVCWIMFAGQICLSLFSV